MTSRAGDEELYRRGTRTALGCWTAIARGATDAAVLHRPRAGIAVFRQGPERDHYNNAILERDLGPAQRVAAVDAMEAEYAAAGIERYGAWTHQCDRAMQRELERRGYALAETTRAMAMNLDVSPRPLQAIDLAPAECSEYLGVLELPAGLLEGADPGEFHVVIARHGGVSAATGMAFDHAGDSGLYNVGTLRHARRRGLATALTARLVLDARARGSSTASLQATQAAERVYASVGFRDVGLILEYAPRSG